MGVWRTIAEMRKSDTWEAKTHPTRRGTSSPFSFKAAKASLPPICFLPMKTFGTVLCPVFSARYCWIALPFPSPSSSRRSSSKILASDLLSGMLLIRFFARLQNGQ